MSNVETSSQQEYMEHIRSLSNLTDKEKLDLLSYLEKTDFYKAPASTQYHGSYVGGLVDHHLNICDNVLNEMGELEEAGIKLNFTEDEAKLAALTHDFCKIDTYEEGIRNVPPNKTASGKWEEQRSFLKKEKMRMGHGSKSLFVLQKLINVPDIVGEAIYWHMGAYDLGNYNTVNDLSETYSKNMLAFILFIADMKATYVNENENVEYED